MQRLLEP